MKRRLQHFEFFKSDYERPQQRWICGWSEEPCNLGPDGSGRCRASDVCVPLRRGERWICTRPKRKGGDCQNGPLPDGRCSCAVPPCQPRRSLRAQRGRLTYLSLAFTFGLLLLVFGGQGLEEGRLAIISPGPLTQTHAAQECASCHAAADRPPESWALDVSEVQGGSALCLDCHSALGEAALKVHGVALDQLRVSASHQETVSAAPVDAGLFLADALGVEASRDAELACADCHREHRGVAVDLQAMDDAQCQVCHQFRFASFADGHPGFGAFPNQRRSRIAFDHGTHEDYFSQAQNEYLCADCHTPDSAGRWMRSANFEQSCSGCHGEKLESADPIDFLTLPVVHLAALDEMGLPVGVWPADADAEEEYEGELTPFTALLLLGDPHYPEAAEDLSLIAELDLLYLSEEDEEALHAVQRMIWGVKRLLYALSVEGHQVFQKRLQQVIGEELTRAQTADLVGRLSGELMHSVIQAWMPQLPEEMERVAAEGIDALAITERRELEWVESEAWEKWVSAGGWYHQRDYSFSIFYKPSGHGDALLRSWLETAGQSDDSDVGREIFFQLRNRRPTSACISCHSVDENQAGAGGGRLVNWRGFHPALGRLPAVAHFYHAPHLNQDCRHCHTGKQNLDSTVFSKAYEQDIPTAFTGNFATMPKKLCARCHTSTGAGDNCLTCHSYHFGRAISQMSTP